MNEGKRFGRKRRGLHFKPSHPGPKPGKHLEREAQQARAEVINESVPITGEPVYERSRYQKDIDRSENVAAGLPPEGIPTDSNPANPEVKRTDYRAPNLDTPAEVTESYEPVTIDAERPKNLIHAVKAVAAKVIKKVQKLIRPVKKIHKEVIINRGGRCDAGRRIQSPSEYANRFRQFHPGSDVALSRTRSDDR